jgi:hypothetical protein
MRKEGREERRKGGRKEGRKKKKFFHRWMTANKCGRKDIIGKSPPGILGNSQCNNGCREGSIG